MTAPVARKETCFFVSPSGDDRWTGAHAMPLPDGSGGPFATPARALQAVAEHKRQSGSAETVRVVFRGGTYFLHEPIHLGPEHGGTPEALTILQAYPGEQPILSGGRRITGWKSGTVNGKNCWVADLPEVKQGTWYFTQLFVDGQRRARTRLPREGFHRFAELPEGKLGIFGGARSARYEQGHFQRWRNLDDVEVTTLQFWFANHLWIDALDEASRTVRFVTPAISDLYDEDGKPTRYWVENVLEAMTEPGDWYLDRPTGRLYYIPREGEMPESTAIVAPRLPELLRIEGSAGQPAIGVRVENLAFRHNEWRLPRTNSGAVQSSYNVPGAVILRHARDCALFGCEVSRVSTYAIEIRRGCTRNAIVACSLFDLGGGGVKVCHERPVPEGLTGGRGFHGLDPAALGWDTCEKPWAVDDPSLVHARTLLRDNAIHHGGLLYPSAIGIWVGDAGHNCILHNHIHHFYYTGISVGWTWGYGCTRTVGNRIENNRIHDIGMGELSDMGGIYTLGAMPGGVIRGNVVHDVTSNGYGGWGIYPDEGSAYLLIENNLSFNTSSAPFHEHYGRDNLVRNNIFANGGVAGVQNSRRFACRGFVMEHNIIWQQQGMMTEPCPGAVMRENLYWRDGGGAMSFGGLSLEEWRSTGKDVDSLIADPLLMDPLGQDMNVRGGSPAMDIGFRPFDASGAGVSLSAQRSASLDHLDNLRPDRMPIVELRLEVGSADLFRSRRAEGWNGPQAIFNDYEADCEETVTLLAWNRGDLPASGVARLRVEPADTGRIVGPTELAWDLQPGQEAYIETSILAPVGVGEFALLAEWETPEGMRETSLLYRPKPTIPCPRLKDGAAHTPDALLHDLPATPLVVAGREVGAVRIGRTDAALLVQAELADVPMTSDGPAWACSGLEVFVSPDAETKPLQFFLLPEMPGRNAGVFLMNKDKVAEPCAGCDIRSELTTYGYRLSASLACEAIATAGLDGEFRLEITASAHGAGLSRRQRATLFRGPSPDTAAGFGYAVDAPFRAS